jgi:hypothetical protein
VPGGPLAGPAPAGSAVAGGPLAELWERHEEAVTAELAALAASPASAPTWTGATARLLCERRHLELVARELPRVEKVRTGHDPDVTTLAELQELARHYAVVPATIRAKRLRDIRPVVDRLRALLVRTTQLEAAMAPSAPGSAGSGAQADPAEQGFRLAVRWSNRIAGFALRQRLAVLAAAVLVGLVLFAAGLVAALLPVGNAVPIGFGLAAVAVPLAALVLGRRPRDGDRAMSVGDAFTTLDEAAPADR